MMLVSPDVTLRMLWSELMALPIDFDDPGLDRYLIASMGSLPQETLGILCLDDRRKLIAEAHLPFGSPCQGVTHLRAIFRLALEHDAAALILVHNHVNGNPTPSENDIAVTRMIADFGRALQIDILDHIVVTATQSRHLSKTPQASVLGVRRTALDHARRTVHRRQKRERLTGAPQLFGDPAWDMLIELFIHHLEGKPVSMSALCLTSGMPVSSALRLMHRLCDKHLLVRVPDIEDGRRHFVELSSDILIRLKEYFMSEYDHSFTDITVMPNNAEVA